MEVKLLEWKKRCNAVSVQEQLVHNDSDFITVIYTYLSARIYIYLYVRKVSKNVCSHALVILIGLV
jgi:hypothetical protein